MQNLILNEWVGNYQFKNPKSKAKLKNLNKTINQIKKTMVPINQLETLYEEIAEQIKNDGELKQKILPIPQELGLKKQYLVSDLFKNELNPQEREILIDWGVGKDALRQLLDENTIKRIKEKNVDIFERINKLLKNFNLTEDTISKLNPGIIDDGLPIGKLTNKKITDIFMENKQFSGSGIHKRLENLEKKAYNELLEFLTTEGKIKGNTYYPGGGGDYNFAKKGIKLIIQDPTYKNKKDEKVPDEITIKDSSIKGSVVAIPKKVEINTEFPDFNTLILKCGIHEIDGATKIYEKLVKKMQSGDNIIEWDKEVANPKELGLVEDPINDVLQKIKNSHKFMFYDPSHRGLNFKVWTKK